LPRVFHQFTAVIIITSYRDRFFGLGIVKEVMAVKKEPLARVRTAIEQDICPLLKPYYFHRESGGRGLYTLRKNE
jgi:hypothetical protein